MSDPTQFIQAASGLQAMGQLFGGVTASRQASAEAGVANAEARMVGEQTVAAEDAQRRQARQFLATQAAIIAQSGSAPTDTTRHIQEQSAIDAELDALAIRYGGQTRQAGLRAEAANAKSRSGAALIGAGLGAGASLLAGKSDIDLYRGQQRLRRY